MSPLPFQERLMITLKAPAKINLFLRLLGKRADGYHEVASLMQTIDLADELRLELADKDQFSCSSAPLETQDNLVIKALNAFRQHYSAPFEVRVHLSKNIPVEAGLGGGSSNAAALLNGLNELLGLPLEDEELYQIACRLGSDVPFFLKGGTAFCKGRGEEIKRLKKCDSQVVWIVKPPYGLSTPLVYQNVHLASLQERDPLLSLQEHLLGHGPYYNDLEEAAFTLAPQLATLKATLLTQGFSPVLLCGSGSSLFCLGGGYPDVPSDYFVRKAHFI